MNLARTAAAAALVLVMGTGTAPPACAEPPSSGSRATYIDPSIGLAGMGRAGVAVFWDDDPEDWANPSLLGSLRGIRYSYGRTQLMPDLSDNVYLTSRRIAAGFAGVGLSLAGKPLDGVGKAKLDYGRSTVDASAGDSFEQIRSLAVGVNVLETVQGVMRLLGDSAPALTRYGEFSVGHTWKEIEVEVSQDVAPPGDPYGNGQVTEKDWGALLRVVPLDRMRQTEDLRFRVEVGGGFARRNYDDSRITLTGPNLSYPIVEDRRLGASARGTVAFARERRGGLADFYTPTVALGITWEESRYYDGGSQTGRDVTRTGQEIVFADVLRLRHGYVHDPDASVGDDTWGIGVGVNYRGFAGARYDWAKIPQSEFLEDIDRNGFTIYVDPIRMWQQSRPSGGEPAGESGPPSEIGP